MSRYGALKNAPNPKQSAFFIGCTPCPVRCDHRLSRAILGLDYPNDVFAAMVIGDLCVAWFSEPRGIRCASNATLKENSG